VAVCGASWEAGWTWPGAGVLGLAGAGDGLCEAGCAVCGAAEKADTVSASASRDKTVGTRLGNIVGSRFIVGRRSHSASSSLVLSFPNCQYIRKIAGGWEFGGDPALGSRGAP